MGVLKFVLHWWGGNIPCQSNANTGQNVCGSHRGWLLDNPGQTKGLEYKAKPDPVGSAFPSSKASRSVSHIDAGSPCKLIVTMTYAGAPLRFALRISWRTLRSVSR